jgi:hypothetical protein
MGESVADLSAGAQWLTPKGLAIRISAASVRRGDALSAAKDRLTVVVICTCLVRALISFGIAAIF